MPNREVDTGTHFNGERVAAVETGPQAVAQFINLIEVIGVEEEKRHEATVSFQAVEFEKRKAVEAFYKREYEVIIVEGSPGDPSVTLKLDNKVDMGRSINVICSQTAQD